MLQNCTCCGPTKSESSELSDKSDKVLAFFLNLWGISSSVTLEGAEIAWTNGPSARLLSSSSFLTADGHPDSCKKPNYIIAGIYVD